MRMSCIDPTTGKWGDIVCRKMRDEQYLVLLGERQIGQLFGSHKEGWTVVSHAQGDQLRGLRLVRGFRRRWNAIEYLLDVGVRERQCGLCGATMRKMAGGMWECISDHK